MSLEPLSTVDVHMSARDMVVQWRRCSLTADFLANFLAPGFCRQEPVRSQVSMVIDELLENAVKFAVDADRPVSVSVLDYGDAIRVEARNQCDRAHAADLEASIRRVLETDPETLFLEAIERSALEDPSVSRLGIITLCTHAGARIGARIVETSQDGLYDVTVQVQLQAPPEPAP